MLRRETVQENPSPADRMLDWYDRSRRHLPWRSHPGEAADPYRVWLSEIMLQQTTVRAVHDYFLKFTTLWPNVRALAAAKDHDVMAAWAGLGYYSRARNLLACARTVVSEYGGAFPDNEPALLALPGVGPYTAAAITAIAFGKRAVVVDGNVERVVSRYRRIEEPLPGAKAAIKSAADQLTPLDRAGDFAQAMMDLGATICTPRKPACVLCPLTVDCAARAANIADLLPVKVAKTKRPKRTGVAFVAISPSGALLARIRPPKGLLGGMTDVPGTPWEPAAAAVSMGDPPFTAEWKNCGRVTHVFTHFELHLEVRSALVSAQAAPDGTFWLPAEDIGSAAFPTVFRKVLAKAGVA